MSIALVRTTCVVLLAAVSVFAAEETIKLDRQKLDVLVDQRAAELLISKADLTTAEAKLALARTWRSGPSIEFGGGYRFDTEDNQWDREIAIRQKLDLWRKERIALASASKAEREARYQVLRTEVKATAFRSYFACLFKDQQTHIHADAVALHKRLLDMAIKREVAGDIGSLEVQVARIAFQRSQASQARALAARTAALSELQILLDISPETSIKLPDQLQWSLPLQQGELAWKPANHPTLRFLASGRQRANRAIDAARADGRPELEVGIGYEHEEGTDIARLGIGLSFGAPGRSEAQARIAMADRREATIAYEQQQRIISMTVATTWKRYQYLQQSYEPYIKTTQLSIAESIKLAEKNYAVGNIPLGDLLSLKRELLEARFENLELKYEMATAALETAAAAALPPFGNQTDNPSTPTTPLNKE